MNSANDFAELVGAAADRAARRELATVKVAIASGRLHAIAGAFGEHARYLVTAMSWPDQTNDLYCFLRLREIQAGPLPPDADFLRDAVALLRELHENSETTR